MSAQHPRLPRYLPSAHAPTRRFDGLTQLHAFNFDNRGGVAYHSRHLFPEIEQHILKHRSYGTFAGLLAWGGVLGQLVTRLLQLLRLAAPTAPVDAASGRTLQNLGVTIGRIAGRLVSKTDATAVAPIDLHTLRASPPISYTGALRCGWRLSGLVGTKLCLLCAFACIQTCFEHPAADMNPAFQGHVAAAHGQRDEGRREFFNFVLEFGARPTYRLFCIPDDDPAGHLLATIQADAAYIHRWGQPWTARRWCRGEPGVPAQPTTHASEPCRRRCLPLLPLRSFAMTENYLVLMVNPLLLNTLKMALYGAPGQAMEWTPSKGVVFYVVEKARGGRGHVATYK